MAFCNSFKFFFSRSQPRLSSRLTARQRIVSERTQNVTPLNSVMLPLINLIDCKHLFQCHKLFIGFKGLSSEKSEILLTLDNSRVSGKLGHFVSFWIGVSSGEGSRSFYEYFSSVNQRCALGPFYPMLV